MKLSFLFACALFPMSAISSTQALAQNKFTYVAETGKCVDGSGLEGLNSFSRKIIASTDDAQVLKLSFVNAECADLRGLHLNNLFLDHWNLKGADLSGAILFFAEIEEASLEGAKIGAARLGYTELHGTADAHTNFGDWPCKQWNDAGILKIECSY